MKILGLSLFILLAGCSPSATAERPKRIGASLGTMSVGNYYSARISYFDHEKSRCYVMMAGDSRSGISCFERSE